jgi:hypothetical protein
MRDHRAVRESDRPIEERVSVLDRPLAETDALPPMFEHGAAHVLERMEPGSLRLAAVAGDVRLYVARGIDEDRLFEFTCHPHGSGASAGPRSTLVSHGARVGWSSGSGLSYGHGIVPDTVTAVRVGAVDAVLGENGFIAMGTAPGDVIVLTTTDGERKVELPSFRPRSNPNASTPDRPGYAGQVEYAQRRGTHLEIADLDDPHWSSKPSTFLRSARAPDVWMVGVVLLEGHRAGEWAFADLVVERDESGAVTGVEFRGQTAFGHPEWPRREALDAHFEPPVPLDDAIDSIVDGMTPLVSPPDDDAPPPQDDSN